MIIPLRSLRVVHVRDGWPSAPTAGDVLFNHSTHTLVAVYTGKRWLTRRFTIDPRSRYVWAVLPNSPTPAIVLLAHVVPVTLPIGPLDVFPSPSCSHLDLDQRTALRRLLANAIQALLERT